MNGHESGFAEYVARSVHQRVAGAAVDPAWARSTFLERLAKIGLDTAPFEQLEIEGRSPQFKYISTPGLSRLEDVTVMSDEWVILGDTGAYLNHCVQSPHPPLSAFFAPFGVMYPKPTQPPVEVAVLLGGCRNYCHWLFDFLPRLLLLPPDLRHVPMLVNGDFTRFQEESLLALGLQVPLLKLRYPFTCQVRNLLVMNIESSCTLAPFKPDIVRAVRSAFAPHFVAGPARRKLWISRASQQHSRLVNAAEAEALAVSLGFEVVHLEHLPFLEQVRLFSQAAVVAGPHGAGFANGVFGPPGMRLIELMSAEFDRKYTHDVMFAFVGEVLGQRVERLIGESVGTCDAHIVNQRYRIDLAALEAVLAEERVTN